MPIKFRCEHCNQLMSIATRKAGTVTVCPRCASDITVPLQQPEIVSQEEKQSASTDFESVEPTGLPGDIDQETAGQSESVTESSSFQFAMFSEETDEEELEFELKRAETDFEELDMTPMVDVTFLLLIFFMVTASFSIQKSIEVPPPDPDQQGAAQTVQPLEELEENSILIEIDEENRFFVESEPVNDPRDLPTILAEVRSKDSKNEVVVSVDERTLHEAVVTAIDAAQEIGMQRIRWGVNSTE